MPKVTQAHLDGRRAEILDGARTAFAKHGYAGATVARLEEATGLSRGAIFHYFGSKRDLFVQLSVEENRRYVDLIVERGVDEALRAMASADPEWLGMLIEIQVHLRHDPEFVRKLDEATGDRDRLVNWLRDGQARGELRQDVDFLHIGRLASIVLNGLALRVVGGDETDVEPLIRLLHDAIGPRQ
jgi:TetR/AcrR family transcriptional regulator, transcriptional repressor of aconitase